MRGASVEDIKAAFRLRSHMFHPDKYENYAEPLRTQLMAEAGKEFKKLTAAYEILRDPARRTAHDRELSARDRQAGVASVRAAPARASTRRAASPATTADGEEAPRRTRRASAPEPPPAPPERDPQILVRPDRLDFGILTAGSTGRLALKVQNVGGRTLFGEVSSNRAWVTVNQRSFISSSVVVFVTADTSGLRAGQVVLKGRGIQHKQHLVFGHRLVVLHHHADHAARYLGADGHFVAFDIGVVGRHVAPTLQIDISPGHSGQHGQHPQQHPPQRLAH